eukprot:CAMPEP_0113618308 /NCGR_PEP_ID=MMETSP0017_2-20120614/9264_1 /TAXON_ID=2856 /ORGANISM="Cylindrotheca closterium" /LENGTH=1027 /DNA_ID=CAMNT_0000527801 /DNA_START=16 /DNA_END=3099 /DNA_ORIENTATION=+ /assembly_acc=CAM_ASM_000147
MTIEEPKEGVITAEVTPTSTDEEAPSNPASEEGSTEKVLSNEDEDDDVAAEPPQPEKESWGWRVYYWVGMLSAFGLGAIMVAIIMQSRESSSSSSTGAIQIIPEAPVNDTNPNDSGLPLLQESTNFPLSLCQGDCDTDADCDLSLKCFQRNENDSVPGCYGGLEDDSLTDYCVAIVLPDIKETNTYPKGLCQGDCDTADDCEAGLVCFQRSANDEVPGCFGGKLDSSNTDYCVPQQMEGLFLKQLGQRQFGGKGDNFGSSISLSQDGSTLAVGAIDAGSTGYVEVYQLINKKSWKFVTTIEGDEIGTEFGYSVSLSGDGKYLAVGIPKSRFGIIRNVGKVLVYELFLNEIDRRWKIVGEIESDNPNIGRYLGFEFGQSVALSSDGSVLAVGEPLDGRIYIYRFFNGFWPKIGNPIQLGDMAGRSLSLSDDGSRLAISGESQGEIFDFDGSDWARQVAPLQFSVNIFQNGGGSIVLSDDGNIVAMGSVDKGVDEIVIQTLQYSGDSMLTALGGPIRLISTDSTVPNIVLSQDGKFLVVGDPRFDGVGRIVLFSYDETTNEWHQKDSVVGRAFNEMFGASLAISQDAGNAIVAIGSPYPVRTMASFGSAVVYKTEYGEKAAETSAPTMAPTASAPAILEQVDSWKGYPGQTAGKDVGLSDNGKVLVYSVTQVGGNGYVESFQRNDNSSKWELLPRLEGSETGANFGHSISLSADGQLMAVGIPDGNDIDGNPKGRVRVYSFNETVSAWIQIGNDVVGEVEGDGFGHAVSLSSSGTIVAIGSPYGTGNTYVYRLEGDEWRRRGDPMRHSFSPALEGWSVSISDDGNEVAVGAPTNEEVSDEAGVCTIFKYIDGRWQRRGQPLFGDARHDLFGTSVSLSGDGDIVAVGSINNDNENGEDAGYVRVYRFNRGTDIWERLGQPILGEASSDRFGVSVSLSNDGMVIAVGANGHGLGGQVRLFQFDEENTIWKQIGPTMNGNVENAAFGASVSISDAAGQLTLAVGAPDTMDETFLGLVRDLVGEVFLYEAFKA